jgi:hypothetical protein
MADDANDDWHAAWNKNPNRRKAEELDRLLSSGSVRVKAHIGHEVKKAPKERGDCLHKSETPETIDYIEHSKIYWGEARSLVKENGALQASLASLEESSKKQILLWSSRSLSFSRTRSWKRQRKQRPLFFQPF